jgi:hypothetical protein
MRRIISLAVLLFLSTQLSARGQVAVTNVDDSGPGSLRQAILDLPDCLKPCHIVFFIAGSPPNGYWTIEPLTPLPSITTGLVYIDGRTQTTYGGDTNPNGPEIVLSGAQAGLAPGLRFDRTGGGSHPHGGYTIRGLGFVDWQGSAVSFTGFLGLNLEPFRISQITIADNYFGHDGVASAPNGLAVRMFLVDDVLIEDNVISGYAAGISVGGGSRVHIASNNIGMNPAKTGTLGNATIGIRFQAVTDSLVERNLIAGHQAAVAVELTSQGNVIRRNEMFANALGIDLRNDGPTPNDTNDLDSGPNELQNHPVIRLSGKTLRGELDSTPRSSFDIDIYETDAGSNQGRRYIGTVTVMTDPNGRASFSFIVPAGSGPSFTATATSDGTGSTSEFSAPVN